MEMAYSHPNSYTYSQAAQADPQIKTWQRVLSALPHDQNDQQTHGRKEGRTHNITYTQAGFSTSKDRKVLNLKFSTSQEVKWLKSLPGYSQELLAAILIRPIN